MGYRHPGHGDSVQVWHAWNHTPALSGRCLSCCKWVSVTFRLKSAEYIHVHTHVLGRKGRKKFSMHNYNGCAFLSWIWSFCPTAPRSTSVWPLLLNLISSDTVTWHAFLPQTYPTTFVPALEQKYNWGCNVVRIIFRGSTLIKRQLSILNLAPPGPWPYTALHPIASRFFTYLWEIVFAKFD